MVIVVVPRLVAPLVYPDLFARSASARMTEASQTDQPDFRDSHPITNPPDQRPVKHSRHRSPALGRAESSFPIGGTAWMTSRIILPDGLGDRLYRHVLTGAEIRPISSCAQHWMFVGQLFEAMPVAILRSSLLTTND